MVERNDPARAGVRAGRIVGLLTAGLAVVSLVRFQGSFYADATALLGLIGIESGRSVVALFWWNVVVAAIARYTIGYVVGSLVGVLYDWLEHPPLPVLLGIVLVVGIGDGLLAGIDTRSVLIGSAYVVAWLCYVPAFYRIYDPDAGDDRSGPLRLG
ncbi:hypothetical protein [Natrinema halophilum]|uniref:Uncharacterized protein n=1 Tax=Natrinema halophilum TaxID=1699371 RepID=A0A7D5KDU9_9EURY|nr:hypothetical protein [Natrinema halophilum]QLG49636.1 hypothetical protein HYG82_12575 [Natrinema halophilum]